MSRFSGKCDFCDDIEIFGLDRILNSDVYLYGHDKPLKLTCLEDCVPYYPYIVGSACYLREGRSTLHLSKRPHTDEIEKYSPQSAERYRELLREEARRFGIDLGETMRRTQS